MIKATGVVRKVDELGRVVLPKELRKTLEIAERDALEVYVSENSIILKKYEPHCTFCKNAGKLYNFKERNICEDCLKSIKTS